MVICYRPRGRGSASVVRLGSRTIPAERGGNVTYTVLYWRRHGSTVANSETIRGAGSVGRNADVEQLPPERVSKKRVSRVPSSRHPGHAQEGPRLVSDTDPIPDLILHVYGSKTGNGG